MALFNRQKKEKRKGQESTIGKIIYGFLLFMPLLSMLVTSMYAIFNRNAYLSYSDTQSETTIVINNDNASGLVTIGADYFFENNNTIAVSGNSQGGFLWTEISIDLNSLFPTLTFTPDGLAYTNNGNAGANQFYYFHNPATNSWTSYYSKGASFTLSFEFTLKEYVTNVNLKFWNAFKISKVVSRFGKLDNAFDYSIKKVEDNNLFNWSKNTGTYTAINTTTNTLGITNSFLPMLLAYWLIISVIYFIYDIGLMLVWVIHRKIHELQEEI